MALQKTHLKNVYGKTLTFDVAYIKIMFINGYKETINMQINIYDSSKKEHIVEQKEYSFIPDLTSSGKNFIQQGYIFLKSLDEYKDAIDLLDEGQVI